MSKKGTWIFFVMLACIACHETAGTPKPRAYPRIEYPERKYTEYQNEKCPFTFRYPAYAELKEREESCWFDLYMPAFKARLHCSYLPVKDKADYDNLVKDAFVIADKINERANYMEEIRIENGNGVSGLALQFNGPAASAYHFFLSDTTTNFFKASLYFDAKVQPDSLAPIVKFIEKDIDEIIQSFSWKK